LYMSKVTKKKITRTTKRKSSSTPLGFGLYYSRAVVLTSMGVLVFMLFLFVFESQRVQEQRSLAATTNCDAPATELTLSAEEAKFMQMLNSYRASNGAPAVKTSPALMRSATWLSIDSSTKNYSAHVDSLGRSITKRLITDCGYTGTIVGENIAKGTGTAAQEIFDLWKASTAGHNEEMLRPTTKVVGIAQSGLYWTLDTGNTDDSALVNTTPPAAAPSVVQASPSFFPLAPCPSCTSPSQVPSQAAPITEPIVQPIVSAEPIISSGEPMISDEPQAPQEPTAPGQTGGGIMDIIKLILDFIKQLIEQLFGGGGNGNGNGNGNNGQGNGNGGGNEDDSVNGNNYR
jgi:uncharacterized protein YkwD